MSTSKSPDFFRCDIKKLPNNKETIVNNVCLSTINVESVKNATNLYINPILIDLIVKKKKWDRYKNKNECTFLSGINFL